ncbi:MAG: glycosyltransferase [Bacteroidaceae bacterium]|nr:glycosyltransferase [Bacteroidaceae bacterium]
MKYSIIVPVFNRPDEVDELLESLTRQTCRDFEVVIVEDGSEVRCEDVVRRYADRLDVQYFEKPNSGPGQSRNYGAERSRGEYLIVLDSDVVLPDGYLAEVDKELTRKPCEAFGGPDRAHESFTPVQKAINYSMTSFFTTGGIRGGKKKLDKFYPRSFNMGIQKSLYEQLGGFSNMRFGEDIDFSIRIFKSGARCRLFPEAWVWHKRRTDFRKFFRQVHNSGIARINLYKKYPESLKLVHLLPAVFTVGVAVLVAIFLTGLLFAGLGWWAGSCGTSGCNMGPVVACFGVALMALACAPLLLYMLLILVDSSLRNRSLRVGLLSIPASFIQLTGYGSGFLRAWWLRCICGRNEELQAFKKTFYK